MLHRLCTDRLSMVAPLSVMKALITRRQIGEAMADQLVAGSPGSAEDNAGTARAWFHEDRVPGAEIRRIPEPASTNGSGVRQHWRRSACGASSRTTVADWITNASRGGLRWASEYPSSVAALANFRQTTRRERGVRQRLAPARCANSAESDQHWHTNKTLRWRRSSARRAR